MNRWASIIEGGPRRRTGDLLYTFTEAEGDLQMFWEAFPACGGTARTTYMFAYADADPRRPSFEVMAWLHRPSP